MKPCLPWIRSIDAAPKMVSTNRPNRCDRQQLIRLSKLLVWSWMGGLTIAAALLLPPANAEQIPTTPNGTWTKLTCTGYGTMSLSFKDPTGGAVKVKNPVLHVSQLGGFLGDCHSRKSGQCDIRQYSGATQRE